MKKNRPGLVPTALLALAAASPGWAATLVVVNTAPSGPGSFLQAILDANATSGTDSIIFQIPGPGVQTISPTTALPSITDPVIIDGTTQPGFAGTPLIELNGLNAGVSSDGFRLGAGNSTIRGLTINRYAGAGIHVQAPGGTNVIEGNFIGTDPTGTLNRGNGQLDGQSAGVWVDGSAGNRIGGLYSTNRNLISGNDGPGIFIQNCSGNVVQGNLIGTSLSGTAPLGNTNNGISLYNAGGNQVGGTSAAARNLISGNGGSGVYLTGPGTTGNLVQGNYIGSDTAGALSIPNAGDGVTVVTATGNSIGGTNAGSGNVVSGNTLGGVTLNSGAIGNVVQGNFIGVGASGASLLGNNLSGVTINGGTSNLVGGTTAAARNVISGNKSAGVFLTGNATGNLVQGCYIGVDVTGTVALGNKTNGVALVGAGTNVIGGTVAGARNLISGNANFGIEIFAATANSNVVQGNYIGLSLTGQSALGNALSGVHIMSSGNTIGGAVSGAGNVISGNGQDGIFLEGAASNVVQGNFIGTTATGMSSLGNSGAGIGISAGAANTIGGSVSGAGNLISANVNLHGIYLVGSGATRNVIQGNKLGTDLTGNAALFSAYQGIYLDGAGTNTIGGAVAGAGNLISGHNRSGIYLINASWNVMQGNWIGTKSDGVSALGNLLHAIDCQAGACNNTIGGPSGAGNRIAFSRTYAGSGYAGVRIRPGSTNNMILGNAIFSNDGLGIDLGTVGVNPNISCGGGTGANMAQNYPVLTQAVSGNGTGIRGTLNSRATQSFLLQFFANPTCDPSGYGEGQIYLGQQTVITSNNCVAGFVVTLPTQVPAGYVITATATDGANNTSEFSACVPVGPVPGLTVSSAAGQQVALAWTNTVTGFVLKQTDSVSPPVQWTTVTNAPVLVSGQYVVTLPATAPRRFYALRFE